MVKINSVNSLAYKGMQNVAMQQKQNNSIQNKPLVKTNTLEKVPHATLQAYSTNISFGRNYLALETLGTKSIEKTTEKYDKDLSKAITENILPRVGDDKQFLNWISVNNDNTLLNIQLNKVDSIYRNAEKLKENGVTGKVGVIGIGGSAHPVEAVGGLTGYNKKTEVLTSVIDSEIQDFVDRLEDIDEAGLMIVSKSGTTTEPAYGFKKAKEIFQEHFKNKYLQQGESAEDAEKLAKEEVTKRIMFVTDADASKSKLRRLAQKEGYLTDVITDGVGGRFGAFDNHVLTSLALEGMPKADMINMLKGAIEAQESFFSTDMTKNLAAQKASFIYDQVHQGKKEYFTYYVGEKFEGMKTWAKQLRSESWKSTLTPSTDIATAVQHYRAEADCHAVKENKRGFYELVEVEGDRNPTVDILVGNIKDYYTKKAGKKPAQPMLVTTVKGDLTPEKIGQLIELDHATTIFVDALLNPKAMKDMDKALPSVTQPNVELFKKNANLLREAMEKASGNS